MMCISIVLSRAIVMITLRAGVKWGQLFQPAGIILVQAQLVVIDENARCDVHRVHEGQTFADSAFFEGGVDLRGNVEESHTGRDIDFDHLAKGLHCHTSKISARKCRLLSEHSLQECRM
jgi:hypothetical protein